MGDGDEGFGALGNGFSLQVDDAVFGDDVHHVGARRGDDVAGREVKHDAAAALALLAIRGGEADKRFASLGRIGAADELQLSAGAADVAVAVGLGGGLALQVDLRGVVDGDDAVVLHDDVRRVGVVDRAAEESGCGRRRRTARASPRAKV